MLIDKVIEVAEKSEKYFQEKGYRDPYGTRMSLLHNLQALSFKDVSWQTDQTFRTKVWLLEEKIHNLVLIVRRLRNEVGLPVQEGSLETKNKHYIEIDIESFFHFAYSILNIIARLTPMLYKPKLKGIKSESFRAQRKWFIDHSEKDKEYSEYLREKTSWFDDLSRGET